MSMVSPSTMMNPVDASLGDRVAVDHQCSSGLPAMVALNRSAIRSSIGETLYFAASTMKSCCSSKSLSCISAARSFAYDQSVVVS
jgi:hypothetical protein